MKTIYTNGKQLFTLENYGKNIGACHANGITVHSHVTDHIKRVMHSKGQVQYIFGIGDSKDLAGNLKRGKKVGSFTIN